jgi:hypothetical protein
MSRDDIDEFSAIDILSVVVSMYGFLLITVGSYRNLCYPFPTDTKILVGYALSFLGLGVLFFRFGFEKKKKRK